MHPMDGSLGEHPTWFVRFGQEQRTARFAILAGPGPVCLFPPGDYLCARCTMIDPLRSIEVNLNDRLNWVIPPIVFLPPRKKKSNLTMKIDHSDLSLNLDKHRNPLTLQCRRF